MEQFIYALTPKGYVLTKSKGVDTALRQTTIRKLCKLKQSDDLWHPHEECLTLSTVESVTDQFHREGVRNHTLIVPIVDYLAYTQPRKLLEEHVWNGEDVPGVLEAKKL